MLSKFEKIYLDIIKQSKKPSKRHIIKEWSYDDFYKVNKDRMDKILDRILSQYRDLYKQELMKCVENDMKTSFHHDDPADQEETAAYVLEKYEYIFRQSNKLYDLLTDEEKVNFEKYCDRFLEGQEGYVFNLYEGDDGFYDEVCEMDPVYKEIVDEINQRNGGPISYEDGVEQSVKKPVSKRKVIKEAEEISDYDKDPATWWEGDFLAAVRRHIKEAGLTCPESKIAGVCAQCYDEYEGDQRDHLTSYSKQEWQEMINNAEEWWHGKGVTYEEEKKVNKRKKVIKESVKRSIKHVRRIRK